MLQHHPGFVSAAPQLHFNLFLVVECLCSYVGPEPTLGLHYGSHLKKEINVFLLLLFIIDWLLVFCPTAPPEFSFIPPPPHAVIRGWGSACSSTQCLSAHSSPWELQISAWGGTEQLHTSCSAVGAGEALGVGRAECCWGAMLE